MLRTIFFALLTANLLFLAWVHWAAPEQGLQSPPTLSSKTASAAASPPLPAACTSVGPFGDADALAQAAGILGAAGKQPRPRTESLQQPTGFAVVITGLRDAAAQQAALATLKRAGFVDARLATEGTPPVVLAGSFAERTGAEQRALRVHALKLEASIEQQTRTVQQRWLDVPGETLQTLPAERLVKLGLTSPDLVTATCP